MLPTDWLYLLYELALVAVFIGLLLTVALSLALHDVEPHDRSRDARRWGGVGATLVTLAFSGVGRHITQGLAREVFEVLVVAGFVLGFPFGVLLWYLLRGRLHTERSSNNRWRGP